MERGKLTMIWVNRLGIGTSEIEGVGDRRVVHRTAVGRGGNWRKMYSPCRMG